MKIKKLLSEFNRFKDKMMDYLPASDPAVERMWKKIQDAIIDLVEEKCPGPVCSRITSWARQKWDIPDLPDDVFDD